MPTVSHVARWVAVTSAAKAALWRSGKVWRAYWNFAGPKQDRMSACAPWVSAKTATAAHVQANFPFSVSRWAPVGEGLRGQWIGNPKTSVPPPVAGALPPRAGMVQARAPHGVFFSN